jgi:hypothetical protein
VREVLRGVLFLSLPSRPVQSIDHLHSGQGREDCLAVVLLLAALVLLQLKYLEFGQALQVSQAGGGGDAVVAEGQEVDLRDCCESGEVVLVDPEWGRGYSLLANSRPISRLRWGKFSRDCSSQLFMVRYYRLVQPSISRLMAGVSVSMGIPSRQSWSRVWGSPLASIRRRMSL